MNLHFEVQRKTGRRSDYMGTIKAPSRYPAMILNFNDDWDDYSYYTWFSLFYFRTEAEKLFLGELKIINRYHPITYDILPKAFDEPLSDDFCSLGIETSYYKNIVNKLTEEERDALFVYLRDCAVFPRIKEAFKDEDIFYSSLIRELSSKKVLDEANLIISGSSPENFYSFSYTYLPINRPGEEVVWDVHVPYNAKPYQRIFGLIGENGYGKTQMLYALVSDFLNKDSERFNESVPHFDYCLVMCSTPFDGYQNLASLHESTYACCCLEQNIEKTITKLEHFIRSMKDRPDIHEKTMPQAFNEAVADIIGWKNIKDLFFKMIPKEVGRPEWTDIYDRERREEFHERVKQLSSGHLQLLSLLAAVYAHVHYSSLLVFDEPEVHLHPKAIKDFMIRLSEVLEDFQSYAIIATHTPLVIREIIERNVYCMYEFEHGLAVSPVNFRTFGEDLSTLYKHIFGYDERESFFSHLVGEYAEKYGCRRTIDRLSADIELGTNARMLIRDICRNKCEEE